MENLHLATDPALTLEALIRLAAARATLDHLLVGDALDHKAVSALARLLDAAALRLKVAR